jgi:hypothetical protein
MWHVTITLNGEPVTPDRLMAGLDVLAMSHPFALAARFSPDTVELRYWDEGHDCAAVVKNALRLWDQHRSSANLPAWPVVGLEILDRTTFQRRWPKGGDPKRLLEPGVRPF